MNCDGPTADSTSCPTAASTSTGPAPACRSPGRTPRCSPSRCPATALAGVRFHPGVAGRWLGVSATELLNRHQPLEEVWERRAVDELSDRLATPQARLSGGDARAGIDRAAARGGARRSDRRSDRCGAEWGRAATKSVVSELIADFGWSERTLRRHCHEAFGYGPKTLERILRFQRFLRLLPAARAPLAVLAARRAMPTRPISRARCAACRPEPERAHGRAADLTLSCAWRSSSRPIWLRWTSSGPSNRRSERASA